jgi:hypothetical protein
MMGEKGVHARKIRIFRRVVGTCETHAEGGDRIEGHRYVSTFRQGSQPDVVRKQHNNQIP